MNSNYLESLDVGEVITIAKSGNLFDIYIKYQRVNIYLISHIDIWEN